MRITKLEKWLARRWTKAGLLYRPIAGGTNFPGGPIQVGSTYLYETPLLALPQTGTKTIFTFAGLQYLGGPATVFIDGLWGVVTTTIGAVANATKLQFVATDNTGTALTAVDMCSTLDINGFTAGYQLVIPGAVASALGSNQFGYHQGTTGAPMNGTFGTTGIIQVNCAGSDGGAGRVKWFLACRTSYGCSVTPAVS